MSQYAKSIVAFVMTFSTTVVGGGIAQGLINGSAAAWATIVIGALATALATIGVFWVKNTVTTTTAPAIQSPAKSSDAP